MSRCIPFPVFLSLVERFSQLAYICARIMLPSCVHSLLVLLLIGDFFEESSVTSPLLRVTLSPWEVRCVAFYVNFYRK